MGVKVREDKKGSGVWYVYINHQGQRKAISVGPKRAAQKLKKDIEEELAAGKLGLLGKDEEKLLFKDCQKIWIEDIVPATCKRSTLKRYQGVVKNHLAPFQSLPIEEITRMQIKRHLLKKVSSGLSKSSVNYIKNAMSGIFSVAIDNETLQYNPTSGLKLKLTEKKRKLPVTPLTRDELSLLLATFAEHRPDHYTLVLLLARTGMRIGEALALQWGDIDFNSRSITVQRGVVLGRIEDSTKNGKDRIVDMSNQLADCLRIHKKELRKKAFAAGFNDVEWIFPAQTWDKPKDKNSWRKRVFYKMLEKAEMRRVRIHDMRHTFASLLIQAGESLVYVKEQLGHHSIQLTVDTYGHLVPGGNREAVNRLDDPAPMVLKSSNSK